VYEWRDEINTKDLAGMSLLIEEIILHDRQNFYENDHANGDILYERVKEQTFDTKPASATFELSPFNLPYYEGLNQYNDKYWLAIYRRDELFSIDFLKEVCLLKPVLHGRQFSLVH
jgi:hypothetical protein